MAREKMYYSISEVADMFHINQSNLRFWEKEFKQLTPRRNEKGTRFYTQDDINVIKQIIYLTDELNLTLEGAKKRLNEKKDEISRKQEINERLSKVRNDLKQLISQLKSNKVESLDE